MAISDLMVCFPQIQSKKWNSTIILCLVLLLGFSSVAIGKTDYLAEGKKVKLDSLMKYSDLLISASGNEVLEINERFKSELEDVLSDYRSLYTDFTEVKALSVVTGPKHKFRIYTWANKFGQSELAYFGFSQYLMSKKKGIVRLVELIDPSEYKIFDEFKRYDGSKWPGSLYYELVPTKKRKSKSFLLLGWDGNGDRTNKKIIEVLTFRKDGTPFFGSPMLSVNVGTPKKPKFRSKGRMVFEYSSKVSVLLKYDPILKMVVFDHLVPPNDRLKGVKATYVPDFSYDAVYFKKGKWRMKFDVDARNETESLAK